MLFTDFLNLLENAWKLKSIDSGNMPKTLLTSQEEYIKSKSQIDYIMETQFG